MLKSWRVFSSIFHHVKARLTAVSDCKSTDVEMLQQTQQPWNDHRDDLHINKSLLLFFYLFFLSDTTLFKETFSISENPVLLHACQVVAFPSESSMITVYVICCLLLLFFSSPHCSRHWHETVRVSDDHHLWLLRCFQFSSLVFYFTLRNCFHVVRKKTSSSAPSARNLSVRFLYHSVWSRYWNITSIQQDIGT